MDAIQQQILTVVTAVIGSIDVFGIIAVIIYAIRNKISTKKANMLIATQVEEAFKNAILPKNIKLDVSNKIEKPIKEGLTEISLALTDSLKRVNDGERLILSVLSLFSHVKQLPTDIQEQIKDYLELDVTDEIKLD